MIHPHVHVVGLGGVGFWLAIALTRLIPPNNITCWDDDTLGGGHGHLRLPAATPTTPKTDLWLGTLVWTFGEQPVSLVRRERYSGVCVPGDVVVDCTDLALTRRRALWQVVRQHGGYPIRVSYDGTGPSVVVATGLPLVGRPTGGYRTLPSLALSFAAGGLGAEVVTQFVRRPTGQVEFAVNLSNAVTPRQTAEENRHHD